MAEQKTEKDVNMDHDFNPGHTGMSDRCNALVMRDGAADDCGLPRAKHASDEHDAPVPHPYHHASLWCDMCPGVESVTDEKDQSREVVQEYAVRTPGGRVVEYGTSLIGALGWLHTDREMGRDSVLLTRTRTVTVTEWTESRLPTGGESDG